MPALFPLRRYFWPTLLCLLGLGFLLLVVWSLERARTPGSNPTSAYQNRGNG